MNKFRVLFTEKCNRSCKKCCNKQYELDKIEKITNFEYNIAKEIIITGGEPLLFIEDLKYYIQTIKIKSDAKIYLYTAKINKKYEFFDILNLIDGITLTIHEEKDLFNFYLLNRFLQAKKECLKNKSLRLNVFNDINLFPYFNLNELDIWKIKTIKWIDDCPIPNGEKFRIAEWIEF